jgi:hypothetical protein
MSASDSRLARLLLTVVLAVGVLPVGFGALQHGAQAATGQRAANAVVHMADTTPPKITKLWVTSVTQTSATIYFETDQPAEGYIDYGLSSSLGRVVPGSPPAPATKHTLTLPSLKPSTSYSFRARAVTAGGQDTTEIHTIRTWPSSATARLTVKKTNADGTKVLTGACWELYTDAGNGTLGNFVAAYCDLYDATPNNGRTVFPALNAGNYVLLETLSPNGYVIGKPRTLSLSAGQSRGMTVKDAAGGTRLKVVKQDQNGQTLLGACFFVYANVGGEVGNYVSAGCDDYGAVDGATYLGSLAPGAYFLWEAYVPTGYVRAPLTPFAVSKSQATKTITVRNTPVEDPDNVVVRAVDANGVLVPGACFTLYDAGGDYHFVASACDGSDGRYDGVTYFPDIAPGNYLLIERWAPSGYQVGKRLTFTKLADTIRKQKITQTPGGQNVTVKTLKGSTTTRVPGACYAVFRRSTGNLITYACDDYDGTADGITRFAGLRADTYVLMQYVTPPGYAQPADRSFTVGDTTASVTVRLQTGVTSASVSEAPPASIVPPKATATASPTRKTSPTATPTAQAGPTDTPTPTATEPAAETSTPEPTATETQAPEPTATETPTTEPTEAPNASPIAQAGPDQEVVDGDGSGDEAVTLDGSASSDPEAGPLVAEWRIGDQVVATDLVAAVTLPVGTYTAVLTVTDAAGASASDEVAIVVAPAPESAATEASPEGGT